MDWIIPNFIFLLILLVGPTQAQQKEFIVKDYNGPITLEFIDMLKDTETLKIINSSITQYPTKIFSRLPKIRHIVVLGSNFSVMDPTIYEDSSQLETILFARNNVPDLPLSLLRNTTFKQIIIEDQDQVKIIPRNFANETKNLKIFHCSRCNIETIEEGAFNNLNELEHLNLHGNSIKLLSSQSFEALVNLQELNLSKNHIEKFTADHIRLNENLEKINLGQNPLKELHLLEVIKTARKLKKLDVRGTKLSKDQLKQFNQQSSVEILSD